MRPGITVLPVASINRSAEPLASAGAFAPSQSAAMRPSFTRSERLRFGWSAMPDQYTLEAFHRAAPATSSFSEIVLTSSHIPWAPLPKNIVALELKQIAEIK